MPFLNEFLGLFRYPVGSGCALLAGTLPLRYSAARFACLTPTWRLPIPGYVVNLVAAYSDAGRLLLMRLVAMSTGLVVLVPVGSTKQKNSSTPRGVHDSFSSHKRRRCERNHGDYIPFHE